MNGRDAMVSPISLTMIALSGTSKRSAHSLFFAPPNRMVTSSRRLSGSNLTQMSSLHTEN